LHHPGIVQIREIGESDEGIFLVLPLVDGETLDKITRRARPPVSQAVDWFVELAAALDYAHENRIVHRDVKPSNVIVHPDGRAMLTDFGLAQNANARLSITQTGELVGTPAFMPPEQIESDEKVDRRADIYSLGALMYFVLSGRLPFDGSFSSVMHQVLSVSPRPLRAIDPRIPRDLEIITAKCLSKSPDDRYRTARELGDDLRRFKNGEVIAAKATGPVERMIKFARRKPYWVAVAATLFVAIAFSGGLLLQLRSVVGQRNRARIAEATNRALLADASYDAGRLAMQRGRLTTAVEHFENALEQNFGQPARLRLHLAECYLALGRTAAATEQVTAAARGVNDAPQIALANYWKAELAAAGVTEFGDAVELMEAAMCDELDVAKRKFLEGINAYTSPQALACFREAIAADAYHHSARRQSLIMALSLADIEAVLRDAKIAQQLYPEDIDFRLLEALALALADQLENARQVIRRTPLKDGSMENWLELAEFVHANTRSLNPGGAIKQVDLSKISRRLSNFAQRYLPLLVERGWRFPPRIAGQFSTLPEDHWGDFESSRAVTRELVSIHPEGTLLIIAAESELDGTDPVEQLESSQKLFLRATEAPGFVSNTRDSAWLGVFATAVNLALVKQHQVEENTDLIIQACRHLTPTRIENANYLRTISILLIENGQHELARGFVDQWIGTASPAKREGALWHLATLHQAKSEWQQVLQICNDVLENYSQHLSNDRAASWTSYRQSAKHHLSELLDVD
jgi:tetratricopeptide (TPR) repeat protein